MTALVYSSVKVVFFLLNLVSVGCSLSVVVSTRSEETATGAAVD